MSFFSNLFKMNGGELMFVKITRPLSFWITLLSFLSLLFLNSFGVIHTENSYMDIMKQILIIMVGFYFTARTAEKIAYLKYKNKENSDRTDLDVQM